MAVADTLKTLADKLGLDLPVDVENVLGRLASEMLRDPLYPSLSKIFEPEEIAAKHLLDSLAPLALDLPCWEGARKVLDIGTGAGFPAFPLAIWFPKVEVRAMDAKGKAVDFIGRIATGVGVANIRPVLGRAEDLARDDDFREAHDLVVCRAVASIRVLLELSLPFVKRGGFALFYKGPNLGEELDEAKNALKQLKVMPSDLTRVAIGPPNLPFERGFLLIRKSAPTPSIYPRRNGLPASRPL